ncbi:MAG: TolC family protein [Rickettsiales bacterium]|nr:TolC family protein [Rickettsiales bacterium]
MKNTKLLLSALVFTCTTSLVGNIDVNVLAKSTKNTKSEQVKTNHLGLKQIVEKVLNNSPALESVRFEALASEGDYKQSKNYVNPQVTIEAEDFSGDGVYSGYDSAQTTYGISQQVLVGGKYGARIDASKQAVKLAYNKFEITKLELIKATKTAYAEAIFASENLKIAIEQKKLAEQVLANVTKRVNAAAEPAFQKSKAEVALANANIQLQKAEQEAKITKNNLANLWGKNQIDFELSDNDFWNYDEIEKINPEEVLSIIEKTPYNIALENSSKQAKANYQLEKANAIPDPTISLGIRQFQQTDNQAFIAGLSIPIPIFNQNKGNIIKAESQLEQTNKSNEATLVSLKNEFINSLNLLEVANLQIQNFKNQVLPSAEKAFNQTRDGYNAGKFPYLEVLDAQRTLFEARYSYNSALKEYHIQKANIERFLTK